MKVLGMFARRPEPGRTKTRLGATIGDVAAADLYAAFVEDLLQRCWNLADRFVVAATPDDAATSAWFETRLAQNTDLVFQREGDLGSKIAWFFDTAAASGGTRIVLIGSDSPDLPATIIDAAFACLAHVDLVLSPASDGGYVLVGLRRRHPELFRQIRWSSSNTCADTLAAAARCGLSAELLEPWYDIDLAQDLVTLRSGLERPNSRAAACPSTVNALQRHAAVIRQVTGNA